MNTLFYGDNLAILQKHVNDASVDLVYLDPPFNSNRDYNVLFREQSGGESPAQIKAFGDTWNWAGAADAWDTFAELCPSPKVIELMHGFHNAIGENDVMAYLVMMAPRLYQLHRVLKPTGSLYLHCDPTASAYLRLILDCLFSPKNFKNEIIWKRTSAHSSAKRFGPVHDTIYYYGKSDAAKWIPLHTEHDTAYVESHYRQDEKGRHFTLSDLTGAGTRKGPSGQTWRGFSPATKGRHWATTPDDLDKMDAAGRIYWPEKGGWPRYVRYLDELRGVPVQDVWDDIAPVNAKAAERLGYPTQKPLALLERIILASSNPGDVVLDPFCLTADTLIVTRQGLRPIADIHIGDDVLTHSGQYRPVTRLYRRAYAGEMLDIYRAKSNLPLHITPNHPVLAVRAAACPDQERRCLPRECRYHRHGKHVGCPNPKRDYRLEWVQAGHLREGDFVFFPQTAPDAPPPTALALPDTSHDNARRLPAEVAVGPDLLEWIGYFAAEGYVDEHSVHFANHEDAARIAALGCRLFGLSATLTPRPYRCTHIGFHSTALARFMEALVGRGAAHKRLPHWVFALPADSRHALIRALLRADGSLRRDKADDASHSYRYSSASPDLAHALYRLLLAEGIACGFHRHAVKPSPRLLPGRVVTPNHPAWQVAVYDVVSMNRLLTMTQEAGGYAEAVVRQPYDAYPFRPGTGGEGWLHTVRRIDRAEAATDVYNLEVDGEHSYVTATMAVHNCGCGTAVIAAEKLGRGWLGIDVTPIATSLIQKRLYDSFGAKDKRLLTAADAPERAFQVEGLPTDTPGAQRMFLADHKKFEMWAVGLVPAIPQEKKGADGGIDGLAYFQDNPKAPSKAVVQVKGGHVGVGQIRDLRGVMARDGAQLGFFVCLETPTQVMVNEARAAGFYQPPNQLGRRVEALQIRTVEQLLHHQPFDFPVYRSNVSYAQAGAVVRQPGQETLGL